MTPGSPTNNLLLLTRWTHRRKTRGAVGHRALIGMLILASTVSANAWAFPQDQIVFFGAVVDSDMNPLSNAVVSLNDSLFVARTDSAGEFRIAGLRPGRYTLTTRVPGYNQRDFGFGITAAQPEVEFGPIVLYRTVVRHMTIQGTITSRQSNAPVNVAVIIANDIVVGLTERDGTFRVPAPVVDGRSNQLSVRRMAYAPVDLAFVPSATDSILEFDITLDPLPVRLEEIIVSADRTMLVPRHLRGFYERRLVGIGHFMTAEDIDAAGAAETSTLLQRVPGIMVTDGAMFGTRTIRTLRGGSHCGPVLIYLDGVRVSALWQGDIDFLTNPRRLAGVEVFNGAAQIPIQYNPTGSACGVILLWSR